MHMSRTADRLFGKDYHWSVLGAGRNQMTIAAQAAALGGNIRVGLEDSLWIGPGRLAQSNAEQVATARQIIERLGLEVATPDEAREILKLKGGDRVSSEACRHSEARKAAAIPSGAVVGFGRPEMYYFHFSLKHDKLSRRLRTEGLRRGRPHPSSID